MSLLYAKWFKPQKDDFLTSRLAVENWKIAIMGSNLKVVMVRTQTFMRRVADKWQGFSILKMQWGIIQPFHQKCGLIFIIVMWIKDTYATNTSILVIIIIIIKAGLTAHSDTRSLKSECISQMALRGERRPRVGSAPTCLSRSRSSTTSSSSPSL